MTDKIELVQKFGMAGTKWDFFVAAVNLFFVRGYSSVSVKDIADVLKVKPASMYYYFLNKDALRQQMYDYCEAFYEAALPRLDVLLDQIPEMSVAEVCERLIEAFRFEDETGRLVGKISHIILDEKNRDERAEKLAVNIFIDMPSRYVRPVFMKMMELDMIEPIDMETFMHLYSSFLIGAVCRFGSSGMTLKDDEWWKTCGLLFSTVRPKETARSKER